MECNLTPVQCAEIILNILQQEHTSKNVGYWYRKVISKAKDGTFTHEKEARRYLFNIEEIKQYANQQKQKYDIQMNDIEEIHKATQTTHQRDEIQINHTDNISRSLLIELINTHEKANIDAKDTIYLLKRILNM